MKYLFLLTITLTSLFTSCRSTSVYYNESDYTYHYNVECINLSPHMNIYSMDEYDAECEGYSPCEECVKH